MQYFCWQVIFFLLFLVYTVCISHLLYVRTCAQDFWSNWLSSFLVPLKNGREYLARGTVYVLINLMRFQLEILVSKIFLVYLRFSFSIFFYRGWFDGVVFQYFLYFNFLSLQMFLCLRDVEVLLLPKLLFSHISLL